MSENDAMAGLAEEISGEAPPGPGTQPEEAPLAVRDLSVAEKAKLKELLIRQQNETAAALEELGADAMEMDEVQFFEHAVALCDQLKGIMNPLRLGGDLSSEEAPFNKLEEIIQWLNQGITMIQANKQAEK